MRMRQYPAISKILPALWCHKHIYLSCSGRMHRELWMPYIPRLPCIIEFYAHLQLHGWFDVRDLRQLLHFSLLRL